MTILKCRPEFSTGIWVGVAWTRFKEPIGFGKIRYNGLWQNLIVWVGLVPMFPLIIHLRWDVK
jgi:hypothetical protein